MNLVAPVRRAPRRHVLLRIVVTCVYIFLFTPIVAVVFLSFSENVSVLTFDRLTLRWYRDLFADGQVLRALLVSIQLGIVASAVAVVLGTMAAFGLVRGRIPGKAVFQAALYAPIVVPEIIVAVALLIMFVLVRIPRGYIGLVIGHSVLVMPYVISIVSARLYGFDRSLEEAASNLGAAPFRRLREVTLPLLLPAMVGAALIAFKVSFDEVVGSIFWSTTREQPLPILVFSMLQWELTPKVNAIGTIMLTVTFAVLAMQQLVEKGRGGRP